ncbi:hypothetical protein GCM10022419_086680 [Nonomuraea rosea]|uniref:Flavoprotein domain-containing protein n=1 Tax=Nonomuraea rosea TaxID=638574 RepID=A0ABP6YUP7_9ACTN
MSDPSPFLRPGTPVSRPSAMPGVSRLLLVVTGSLAARNLPFALTLLRGSRPGLSVRAVVTRNAERFVTRAALAPEVDEVMVDEWPDDAAQARHVEWAEWAQAVVVYPMTLHFMGRLALGLADTPALLAAQCTRALVVLAPALPPGGVESAAYQSHWSALRERPNVVLVPPRPGISTATGRPDSWLSTLAQAIEAVDARWDAQGDARWDAQGDTPGEERRTRRDVPAEDGTGHLLMEVTPSDGGFVWRRRPGRLAHSGFAPVDSALNAKLAGLLDGPDVRLAPGEQDGESRAYRVAGAESAARVLLRDGPTAQVERLMRGLGRALREVHAVAPGDVTGPPRALRRLEEWLAGDSRSAPAAAAGAVLADRLGAKSWERLRDWCAEQNADPDVVLSHGAPGLGSLAVIPPAGQDVDGPPDPEPLAPAPDVGPRVSPDVHSGTGSDADPRVRPEGRGVGELLIGEDVCAAPWYHDLAWIAGELVELRWLNDGDPQEWQRLLDALFEGYGRDLGEDANRLIALRIALHLHDISAYVGLDAALLATYAGFLDFLVNLDGGSPHARTS